MKIGYFEPSTTYDYIRETDNAGHSVQFSWNYPAYGSYGSSPKSTYPIYSSSIKNGQLSTDANFTGLNIPGVTAVLLDVNGVPLDPSRYHFSAVPFSSGAIISNVTVIKAVQKQLTPIRKYRIYFSDGSIGDSDTYTGGTVTGTITSTSSKGSVVMPIGAHFKCSTIDNANVFAQSSFTPVLPTAIKKFF
jgi:hypothetical protein